MLYKEIYFYTATINDWKPLIQKHNFYSTILDSLSFLHAKECIAVYGFVIMPNHIHLIWEMLKPNGKEIPSASFMKFTAHSFEKTLKTLNAKELDAYRIERPDRKYNFWQQEPDTFLLHSEVTIRQKLDYMHNNPMQPHWQLTTEPLLYPYSSAYFYETGNKNFGFLTDYREWAG